MRKKTWIAIGIISLLIIMISVSVYRQVLAKGPSVETVKIKQEEIASQLLVPGTIKLQEEQIVYAAPDKGELKELLVEEGQTVTKGTVLAKLQNPQLDLEVEQNKLASESANLRIKQFDQQIKELKEKEKTLADSVGKEEAKKQITPELEQLELQKKLTNIELKQASLQKDMLSKRQDELEIKSSIDGIVLTANKSAAEAVTTANVEPILHIGKLEGMVAAGVLSEYDTLKASKGQNVLLRTDAIPGQEWKGIIAGIAILPQQNQSGIQNGSQAVQYPVTVEISGDTKNLKPGFQVNMEIETDKKSAMVLPVDAVQDEGDQPYVFIVRDGKAHKQKIKTGIVSGDKMEIIEGVLKGDQVIVKHSSKLKDGLEVTVK